MKQMQQFRYVRWLSDVDLKDTPLVGGKYASLGELYRELLPQGINVPNGFAITAEAYWEVIHRAGTVFKPQPVQSPLAAGIDQTVGDKGL